MLVDADVARRHLRLVLRSGRTYVEDLAGGARLNGRAITGTRELLPGDSLTLGQTELSVGEPVNGTLLEVPVVSAKAGRLELPRIDEVDAEATAELEPTGTDGAGSDRTQLLDREGERVGRPVKSRTPAPARQVAAPPVTSETRLLDRAPGRGGLPPQEVASESGEISYALEQELAPHMRTEEVSVPDEETAGEAKSPVAPGARTIASMKTVMLELPPAALQKEPAGKPPQVDPLQRSRIRREAQESLGGLLKLTWIEMSERSRRVVIVTAILFGLATGVALGLVFIPRGADTGAVLGPEPEELTHVPTQGSFGFGPGVDYENPDHKSFTFPVSAATRMAAVLHYQAEGLSEGELALSINGVDQGFSPADTASTRTREVTIVLPPSVVRRDGLNTVVFDSIRNPPARDPWRIWNVWVELLPLPDLPPRKLLELAKEHARLAGEAWEAREIASGNLFQAWKYYRNAWLSLEGLDGQERSDLYRHVRFQMGALSVELDKTCSRLTLAFERSMTLKQRKQARQALEEMERVFPSPEHRCHNLARERRAQLEL